MRYLIVYATTEGQTLKIARFAADRLSAPGHSVEILSAEAALAEAPRLGGYDGVLVMGSVHMGRYQQALADFAVRHLADLTAQKAAFVSVSLACLDEDPKERANLEKVLKAFADGTGWAPEVITHVAGAFRFTQYDFFKAMAMRYIARTKGVSVEAGADTEFTDWAAFGAFLDGWGAAPQGFAAAG